MAHPAHPGTTGLPVKIQFLSLVEITEFRLESKSCRGFFFTNKISTPPMRALESITGHVMFKLRYNQINNNENHLCSLVPFLENMSNIRKCT